ncbi:hypothetical protein OS493_039133, partial [Desmophyllum pertusum]
MSSDEKNVVMAWRINKHGGVYKKGAAFSFTKAIPNCRFLPSHWQLWRCCSENMCTYDTARNIVDKFLTTGLFTPGGRGSPPTIMQPWKVAYLEALVTHDPF